MRRFTPPIQVAAGKTSCLRRGKERERSRRHTLRLASGTIAVVLASAGAAAAAPATTCCCCCKNHRSLCGGNAQSSAISSALKPRNADELAALGGPIGRSVFLRFKRVVARDARVGQRRLTQLAVDLRVGSSQRAPEQQVVVVSHLAAGQTNCCSTRADQFKPQPESKRAIRLPLRGDGSGREACPLLPCPVSHFQWSLQEEWSLVRWSVGRAAPCVRPSVLLTQRNGQFSCSAFQLDF